MARFSSYDFFLLPRHTLRAQLLSPQLFVLLVVSALLLGSASRRFLVSPLQRPANQNSRRTPGGENDNDPARGYPIFDTGPEGPELEGYHKGIQRVHAFFN